MEAKLTSRTRITLSSCADELSALGICWLALVSPESPQYAGDYARLLVTYILVVLLCHAPMMSRHVKPRCNNANDSIFQTPTTYRILRKALDTLSQLLGPLHMLWEKAKLVAAAAHMLSASTRQRRLGFDLT